MKFAELRRRLRAEHLAVLLPWEPIPADGWHTIVWPSEFHPEGWSIRITHPHRITNACVESSFAALGYWVQASASHPYCGRLEAWPVPFPGPAAEE